MASLLILLLSSTVVFAETDYEKKLEYRRKKVQIMVKTSMLGESSGYTTTDNWSSTISPEAGYSYTYAYGTQKTNNTVQFKEISNWVIVRGGVRELSDVEFLQLTGNNADAKDIQAKIDERNKWMTIGTIGGVIGIGVAIAGSSNGDVGTLSAGTVLSILGFLVSSFNLPQRHYIAADYALEQSDLYNIKTKKELGLPIDLE
jgi:hypothetical protein